MMSFAHRVSAVVINLSGAGLWTISKSATRGQSRCFGFTFGNLWRGPSPLTVSVYTEKVLCGLPLTYCHWSDSFRKVTKSCRFHSGCRSVKEELLFSRVATLSRVSLCCCNVWWCFLRPDVIPIRSVKFGHRSSQGSDQVPLKVWRFPASKCTLFKWQVEPPSGQHVC